jgi:hypothetical protein
MGNRKFIEKLAKSEHNNKAYFGYGMGNYRLITEVKGTVSRK